MAELEQGTPGCRQTVARPSLTVLRLLVICCGLAMTPATVMLLGANSVQAQAPTGMATHQSPNAVPGNAISEPPIPAGLDPGGIAVALLGPGIDYTHPELIKRLARDGEGDAIGWDFADKDTRPFAKNSPVTHECVGLLKASARVRLIIVKEALNDPVSLGRMVNFATQTPAKILVWLDADKRRPDFHLLARAAARFREHLFVSTQPPVGTLPANLVVASGADPAARRAHAFRLVAAGAEHFAAEPILTPHEVAERLRTVR